MATTMRVPTIFTAVDKFSDVVSRMSKSVSAFGATAEASAMRTSRSLSSFGTSMLTGGVAIATGLGYAINEAGKFEKSISNISTLTENTPEQMKAIGDSILEISKKVPVAISDLTSGMYDVVSAGITGTANQLEVLKRSSILAVAGLGTTKEAVNITTSSLNAFGISASKAESVTNLLMKAVKYGKTTVSGLSEGFGANAALIKNSSVTLEEYLATTATLTTTGMTAARAQTQVASAVGALIKPSGTMTKIYARLGVKDIPAFIKANGGLVGTMEVIKKTSNDMGLTLSKAFGRKEGYSALLSLLGPLSKKYKEVILDMISGNDIVNTAFAKQQKTFSAGVQRMKNNLGVLAIKIGEELIPRMNGFIDSVSKISSSILSFVKKNEGLVTFIANIALGMLTIGILAKTGAVLFYGLSKAIAVVSAVTRTYTFISTLAALANVSFGKATLSATGAMWKFVASELAVLAPLGLVALALADLAIAYKLISDATRKTMFTTIDSYKRTDATIKYSTIVMQSEFDKQYNAMVNQRNRIDAFNGKPINVGNIGLQANGYYNMGTPSAMGLKDSKTPFLDEQNKMNPGSFINKSKDWGSLIPGLSMQDNSNIGKPKNVAGTSDFKWRLPEIGGELKVTVTSNDGSKVDVDSSKAKGVKVNLGSTLGQFGEIYK